MKYIKLFMLLAVVSLFAACSSDDDYNTNETTVSFANNAITTKESAGIVNIPINVTGLRNGDISLRIVTEEVGANPAKEDVNYMITDKTLTLKADTLQSGVINVEVKMVDDDEINENRTFKLTIASLNGATVGTNASTTITIRDNDAAFYEKFFGKWTLSGNIEGSTGVSPFSKDVTISGVTDEESADYNNILTVSAPGLVNVGVSVDCEWHFRYSFNTEAKTGTLGFICGEIIGSYGDAYQWMWASIGANNQLTTDDVTAPWALGENDAFPTTITFPESASLAFYQPGNGVWRIFSNLKLTKK